MDVAPWIANWIMMVSDGIRWYCMVLDGILLLNSIHWYSMVLHGLRWYYPISQSKQATCIYMLSRFFSDFQI